MHCAFQYGNHRYALLLFRQPTAHIPDPLPTLNPLGVSPPVSDPEWRAHFNMADFAAEHGLGAPFAATFFYSGCESDCTMVCGGGWNGSAVVIVPCPGQESV